MKRTLVVWIVVLGLLGAAVPASSAFVQSPVTAQETAELPPGLSEEGVTDPLALVSAHRQTLENTSYVVSTTTTYRRPNGTLLAQSATAIRVAPGAESYYATTTQTVENETRPLGVEHYDIEVWANETRAVTARHFADDDPTYRQTARSDAVMEPTSQWELLYAVFGSTETDVVGQLERDGTTLFRVVSTPATDDLNATGPASELRYEFTALVDSQGVVHSVQMSQRTDIEDEPAIVSRTVHVTEIGNTTVERPEWFEQAMQNETA